MVRGQLRGMHSGGGSRAAGTGRSCPTPKVLGGAEVARSPPSLPPQDTPLCVASAIQNLLHGEYMINM